MKKNLSEAIAAGDAVKVRTLLLEMLRRDAGRKDTLLSLAAAIEMPNLFENPSGVLYILPKEEWNLSYARAVEEGLVRNFTRDGLRHYSEVMVELAARRRNGDDGLTAPSADSEVRGEAVVLTEVSPQEGDGPADGALTEIVAIQEVEDLSEEPVRSSGKRRPGYIGIAVGYCLMAIGVLAAIVSLFLPVKFLLGLGIGTLMVGSAVTYGGMMTPTRRSRRKA